MQTQTHTTHQLRSWKMKMLLLLSTLVTSSLARLLIPREKYLKHQLMVDGENGRQCDDCCDKGVRGYDCIGIDYWLFVICHLSFVIYVFVYSCIYFFATTFMLKRIKHSNFFLIAATIKSQDQIFWRNTRKILALCKWYDFFQRTGTRWRSVRRRANGDVGEYQIVYVNFTPAG